MADLAGSELLERVRAATGNVDPVTAGGWLNTFGPWECETPEWHLFCRAANGDMNSALALVERVRPGRKWLLTNRGYDNGVYQDGKAGAAIQSKWSSGHVDWFFGATPALALLAALLASLEESDERT